MLRRYCNHVQPSMYLLKESVCVVALPTSCFHFIFLPKLESVYAISYELLPRITYVVDASVSLRIELSSM